MAYTGSSIVDYLKSIGGDSSFAARKKKAAELGIANYTGTAEQNIRMLNMLRSGAGTKKPEPPKTGAQTYNAASTMGAGTSSQTSKPNYDDLDRQLAKQMISGNITYDDALRQMYNAGAPLGTEQLKQLSNQTSQPIQPVYPAQSNYNAALYALESVSPTRQRVNELVEKLISGLSATPYNPATDPSFQAAKTELEKQAERAYGNVATGYLGNQSGNFNTAAQQIASTAKNELLGRIPALQSEFEDRYNTQQRQQMSDISSVVNTLLGIEEMDYARQQDALERQQKEMERKKQEYIDTIDQYYGDLQAEINRLEASDDPDKSWKIPLLKVRRAQKIASMDEKKLAAKDKAVKYAFELWDKLGYVPNQTVADLLGLPVNTRTAEYADTLADNAKAASSSKSKSANSYDFGIALQTMLSSGNPMQWLEENADVLTEDEIKGLYSYAKNAGIRADTLMSQATQEQRGYYQQLKDVYINGKSPLGGDSQYKDNPQAALNRLRSDPMSRELLGPLYAVLESELVQKVEEKKEQDKANKQQVDLSDYLNE